MIAKPDCVNITSKNPKALTYKEKLTSMLTKTETEEIMLRQRRRSYTNASFRF